eukprot:1157945-Pelagomonas_calceolata.AAC.6
MYKECYVILRKILRVVESLPLTADDMYSKRSAHGTFANILQELCTNQVCCLVLPFVRAPAHVCMYVLVHEHSGCYCNSCSINCAVCVAYF